MAAKIKVLNGKLKPLGSTSKAFNAEKTKELMREYFLSFSVVNTDSVFDRLSEDSVFLYEGQYFDVSGIDGDSGSDNVTQITAEHISYRMANYTLPNTYSFVGTVKQIAEDILAEGKTVDGIPANTVFSLGECADVGTVTFALSGTNITVRDAFIGMSKLGVEVDFDNFTVHLPKRIGTDGGISFEYGKNLNGVHRTWQKGNGWSYDIKIVDLQKVHGNEDKTFSLGDTVTVYDTLGKQTLEKRIISYTECDDPSQNRITVGVFVRDSASFSIETEHLAMQANDTANNSVQLGRKYNNLSITHENGFEVITLDNNKRLLMNGQDGFAVQVKKNGEWVTVTSTEEWGILTPRLTTQAAKDEYYATVGTNEEGNIGFFLYRFIDGNWVRHLDIWTSDANNTVIESKFGDLTLKCPTDKNVAFERKGKGGYGINGSVDTGTKKLTFANGILEETADSDSGIKVFKSASGNSVIENTANENLVLVVPDGKAVQFKHKNGNYYGETGTLTLPGTNVSMTFECGLLTAIGRWE